MGVDHDRRARAQSVEVLLEPGQLIVAEDAEAAGLEVPDIDQPDEVDALEVEAPPAVGGAALAEAVEVRLAVVDEGVVLAGHVEHLVLAELRAFEDLIDRVELGWHREVAHVAGVQHEGRPAAPGR